MPRLVGTHDARLDSKGRLTLPALVRPALGQTVILTAGIDPCVLVYPEDSWALVEESIMGLSAFGSEDAWIRRAFGEATEERTIDEQGRILISEGLREQCGLGRDVLVVGVFDKLEVWDRETYQAARSAKVTPDWRRSIGERL